MKQIQSSKLFAKLTKSLHNWLFIAMPRRNSLGNKQKIGSEDLFSFIHSMKQSYKYFIKQMINIYL